MKGFAVRNDGQPGWRAISGDEDLLPNEVFSEVEPPPFVPLPPSNSELAAMARVKRDELMVTAANRMGALQDAVDIDRATPEERKNLMTWKAYRVDLNRIEQQDGFPLAITWPVSPDSVSTE